ncbi:hypothetical protein M9H77_18943 [Catharanthus roseus]|uniref:Uncharacterized protein n=1 Tax=Catharanthus roseus TaxID=4058 RepID=A0ACC0B8V9_CATRO|nr:hypothetical protein M9H77_18943 [Catharanthus roseus]
MGFQKGRKASLAFTVKNACEDSCSRSRKVLGKFLFQLLLVISSASNYSSGGKLITVRKQINMPISEFPHVVASINAIQSLRLSAVKIAVSGERASNSSQGY